MAAVVAEPRRRDALGACSLLLGLAGVAMGLAAARYAWCVVVPIGLLTLILGLIDLGRARHDAAANSRAAVAAIVIGAAALALGIWGTGMFLGELSQLLPGSP
jgi:hypothetical protein